MKCVARVRGAIKGLIKSGLLEATTVVGCSAKALSGISKNAAGVFQSKGYDLSFISRADRAFSGARIMRLKLLENCCPTRNLSYGFIIVARRY